MSTVNLWQFPLSLVFWEPAPLWFNALCTMSPTHLIEIIKVLSVIVWIECSSVEQMVAEIPIGPEMEAFTIAMISIRKSAIIQVQSSANRDLSAKWINTFHTVFNLWSQLHKWHFRLIEQAPWIPINSFIAAQDLLLLCFCDLLWSLVDLVRIQFYSSFTGQKLWPALLEQ